MCTVNPFTAAILLVVLLVLHRPRRLTMDEYGRWCTIEPQPWWRRV